MQFQKKLTSSILILLFILTSCGSNALYENHKELESGIWQKANLQSFEIEIDDSQNHSVFYHLRYTMDYDYCNSYVRYKVFSPTGKLLTQKMKLDTLFDCTTGKPLGEGFGTVYNREFQLEESFDFSEKGIYKIELEQMMRKDSLEGIQTVGIRITN
ncbi:gliding motility lipoprotein GldH [Bernardetia sp. ABR2-2B]|uniref:gliding motility lipoprotein GldH n=1 Tax=Bernardetia sp. ABR2-2B TaxID=3127472 RepID=UPI0030CED681